MAHEIGPENLEPPREWFISESDLTPEIFFGELALTAEVRLLEAVEKQRKSPSMIWTTHAYDVRTRVPMIWFRLGQTRQFANIEQELLEVGMPEMGDLTEEPTDTELATRSAEESFMTIRDPRLDDNPTYRITIANAQNLASDSGNPSLTQDLLRKMSQYHVHPIRLIQKQ